MSFTCSCSCSVTKTVRIVASLWLIAATIWSLSRVRVCLFFVGKAWRRSCRGFLKSHAIALTCETIWDRRVLIMFVATWGKFWSFVRVWAGEGPFFLGLEIFFVRKTEALFQVKDWGVLPVQLLWGAREIHSRCSCRQNQFWGFRYLISSRHHQQGFGYSFSHAVLWWRSSRCPGLTIFFHQGT